MLLSVWPRKFQRGQKGKKQLLLKMVERKKELPFVENTEI